MSTTIDNRVVEMRFDNKQFESNAKATLQTLKNLDKSVNSLESVKGLENISKAANKTDMSGLERGVEAVKVKFSALEVIAITALTNIANKAVNAGERLLKSFTTDNIVKGWDRYADKTSSVQTIMAATANQFSDTAVRMRYVENELEKLNWFTDETSFKFTDMVNNIGKFTSAGVKLDSAVGSMQGIAVWAAKSGASAEQASHAMYNLSQAMSIGKLTIQDWKSIENANMATLEFKQTAIDTAIELGTLTDMGNGFAKTMKGEVISAAKGFRDSLREGWLNTQVMEATFNKYNEFTDVLYEASDATGLFATRLIDYTERYKEGTLNLEEAADIAEISSEVLEEHLKKLSDDSLAFGREAFKFAYEAKTFQEAIDYVGEAVSSTWLNTFEIIFGNYEQAKKLWTGVADELYELFVVSGERRNELLEGWAEFGGREKLFEGLLNVWENIKNVLDAVKDAFREIFPPKTSEDLMRITTMFAQFTEKIRLNKGQLDGLQRLFEGLFAILRVGKNIIENIIYAFSPLAGIFKDVKSEGQGLKTIGDVLYDIAKAINKASNYIAAFIHILLQGVVQSGFFQKALGVLKTILVGIIGVVVQVISAFRNLFSTIGRSNIFNGIANGIKSVFNNIRKIDVVNKLGTALSNGFSKVTPILNKVGDAFKVLVGVAGLAINKIIEVIRNLVTHIIEIGTKIKESFENGGLSEVFSKIKEYLKGAGDNFKGFIDKLREFASSVSTGKIAAMALSITILLMATSIAKAAQNFGEALSAITGVAKAMSTTIAAPFKSLLPKVSPLLSFAVAVLAVAHALKTLANDVDPGRLKSVIASISTLTVVIGAVASVMMVVNKFTKGAEGLKDLGKSMLYFGVAIGAMMAGLALLNASGSFTDAGKKIGALIGIITAFGLVATLMSRFSKDSGAVKSSLSLISFALSINVIIKALSDMADLPMEGLREKVILLAGLMAALGVMAAGLGNIRIGSAVGIMLMLPIIKTILPSIVEALSNVKLDDGVLATAERYIGVIGILGTLAGVIAIGLTAALGYLARGMGKLGSGLAFMAIAIALCGKVAESIKKANFSTEELVKAGAFIGGLIVLFGLIAVLTKGDTGKNALKLSVMILTLTVAMGLLTGLMAVIGLLDVGAIIKGGSVIGALMILFAVVIAATKAAEKAKPAVLIAAVLGIVILAAELIALTFIPWQSLLPAVVALGAVMLAFAVVLKSLGNTQFNAKSLIGMISAIVMLGAVGTALYILQDIPWQNMLASGVALSATLIALAAACKLVSGITKSIDSGSVMMLVAVVLGLSGAITILSMISTDEALKNAIALAAVMVALGVMAKLISGVKFGFDQLLALAAGVGAMIVVVMMLNMLVPALQGFQTIDWETLGKAGATLAGLTAALFVLSKAGLDGVIGAAGLIIMAGALALMTPALQLYQNLDWETIGKAGAVLAGLTVALLVLSKAGLEGIIGAAGLIVVALALAIMVPILQMYQDLEWETIGKAGAVLLGLTAALTVLGLVGVAVIAGAAGILAMAIGLAILAPIMERLTAIEWGLLTEAGSILLSLAAGVIAIGLGGAIALVGAPGLILLSVALMLLKAVDPQSLSDGLTSLGPALTGLIPGLLGAAVGAAALAAAAPALIVAALGLRLLSSAVQEMSVSVIASVQTMAITFTTQMQTMQIVAEQAGRQIGESLRNGMSDLKETGEKGGKDVEEGFRDGIGYHSPIEWATSAGEEIDNSLANGVKSNEGAATEAAEGLASKIGAIFSKLAEGIKKFLSGLGGAVSGLGDFGGVVEEVTGASEGLKTQLEGLVGENGDLESMLKKLIPEEMKFDKILEESGFDTEKLTEGLDGLDEQFQNLGGGGGGGGSVGQATNALSKLSDTIRNQISIFDEWSTQSAISADQMLNNMRSQIAGVTNWANNMRILGERGINQGLLQALADLGPQGSDKVQAFVSMTNEQLAEAGSLYQQSLALPDSAAAYVVSSFGNAGGGAARGFVNGLTPIGGDVGAWAQEGVDAVHDTWEEHSPSEVTRRTGHNVVDGLKGGINDYLPSFLLLIEKVGRQGAKKFEEVGKMLMEGFALGIENNTAIVEAAAAKAAEKAEEAAERALDMASPSKLAERRLGRFFDMGFAMGIEKYAGEPMSAASGMALGVAKAVEESMAHVDEILNTGIDLNPVITPRLDLGGMTTDMAAVNGIFENKRLGVAGVPVAAGAEGSGQVIFNQYNNSPKALSRTEIYRQTNNQINFAFRRNKVGRS